MSEFLETIKMYFSFPFVQYAFIAGIMIAIVSSLLGVTLVLKRFSYIGDGLSHTAFGAMAMASVLKISHSIIFVLPVTVFFCYLDFMYNRKWQNNDFVYLRLDFSIKVQ